VGNRDEDYVTGLCDQVLNLKAERRKTFDFLRGDPGKNGVGRKLPVDAYYETLELVIEYRERQHTEPVPFLDKRQTCSNCGRGEQRRRYDQRRRDILLEHGIHLIEIDYRSLSHNGRKRLIRNTSADELAIRGILADVLGNDHGHLSRIR